MTGLVVFLVLLFVAGRGEGECSDAADKHTQTSREVTLVPLLKHVDINVLVINLFTDMLLIAEYVNIILF